MTDVQARALQSQNTQTEERPLLAQATLDLVHYL